MLCRKGELIVDALTDEQRELVVRNHKLIFSFCSKYGVRHDEYYDILAIGLIKAVIAYDDSRGKFSTFAYTCMQNELYMEYRKKKYIGIVSLDQIIDEKDDNDAFWMNEGEFKLISDSNKVMDIVDVEIDENIDNIIYYMSTTDIYIILCKLQGKMNAVIAADLGIDTSSVSRRMSSMQSMIASGKVRKWNYDDNVLGMTREELIIALKHALDCPLSR